MRFGWFEVGRFINFWVLRWEIWVKRGGLDR